MGFDHRDAWIAVRSESINDVLTALDSRSVRDCRWSEGVTQSFSTAPRTFFISAPIDGEIWCAGQRVYDLLHDGEPVAARISDFGLAFDAPVRVPSPAEVEGIANKAPSGIIARERWIAPPLEGSSMPEPPANPPLIYAATASHAESAARGSTFARWGLEAIIVFRSFRSPGPAYDREYQPAVMPNSTSEAVLIIAVIVLFELAVFIANIIDKRQTADARSTFRVRATRILVVTAGAAVAGSALYVDDAFLLMAGGFVAIGGVIAASYIPDALFGGTKPDYN
jgi:hypothetical protein